jgi:plasmid stability protein
MARKPTDEVQLKLRFQEGLRQRLEYLAARNQRSMNSEIIHALEQHVLSAEPSGEIFKLLAEPSGNQGAWQTKTLHELKEEREAQRNVQEQILQELKRMNAQLGAASSVGHVKKDKAS